MNDIGYLKMPYKDSEVERSTKSCNNIESLVYKRDYIIGAIDFHKRENNLYQVEFFSKALKHIDKRIKILNRKTEKGV